MVSAGIILSSNWNYFIKSNQKNNIELNSYQISATSDIYTKYNQEASDISFQINVLRSSISKNNIMKQQYDNVFKHNISYNHLQKNTIRNKIRIANYTISHELDVLNTMRNIIHSHPYNYLKFFREKNYTIPEIVSPKILNTSKSANDIKTNTNNINNSNISTNSITYQSEEAAIGIHAISSIISCSKMLIFSKVNFNYNSIYYFSSNLNKISTVGAALNVTSDSQKLESVKSKNQLLNYGKTNGSQISSGYTKNKSKNKKNTRWTLIKHFLKKEDVLISSLVAGASLITFFVSTFIGLGVQDRRKLKVEQDAFYRREALLSEGKSSGMKYE